MAAGMSSDADPARLSDRLGSRWALLETSFKFHASCRHTHPAADALLKVIADHGLASDDIASVTAHVHQGALDVLGPVTDPATVHQAKFSMPATLGLIAVHGRAGMAEYDAFFADTAARAFNHRVHMRLDPEVDAAYPARWIGKVTVITTDGRTVAARVDEPKGDPGNTLSRDEIDEKARRLIAYGRGVAPDEVDGLMARLWGIAATETVGQML
jgi:2-methylcitrate dehydratase PrpD